MFETGATYEVITALVEDKAKFGLLPKITKVKRVMTTEEGGVEYV